MKREQFRWESSGDHHQNCDDQTFSGVGTWLRPKGTCLLFRPWLISCCLIFPHCWQRMGLPRRNITNFSSCQLGRWTLPQWLQSHSTYLPCWSLLLPSFLYPVLAFEFVVFKVQREKLLAWLSPSMLSPMEKHIYHCGGVSFCKKLALWGQTLLRHKSDSLLMPVGHCCVTPHEDLAFSVWSFPLFSVPYILINLSCLGSPVKYYIVNSSLLIRAGYFWLSHY